MDTSGNFGLNTSFSFIRRFSHALFLSALLAILLPASPAIANNFSGGISTFLGGSKDDVLPPDEAFKLSIVARDLQTLEASFIIAPRHYLYRDRIQFSLKSSGNGISEVLLPPGEPKLDPTFGQTDVYYRNVTGVIHLANAAFDPITIEATFQGCSEKGLCYAPIKKVVEVNPGVSGANLSNSGYVSANPGMGVSNGNVSDDSYTASLLQGRKLWLIIAGFFGFGLLLSLTPCVLPMIPILSSIIVGNKTQPGRLHSFYLSLAYTLGMALTYTLLGIAAGLSGQLLSAAFQNIWGLGLGSLIFVLLALSMFGFYELQMPSGLESRIVNYTNRIKGGRFLGVFFMGAVSALILSPCVAAPLAGALLYISQSGDIIVGGIALFALSMGMGVPLLLLGASAGTLLPKTGPWMNTIRNFFGVILLGMAVWLISPVIPVALEMALWAALLIVPAVYLHALDSLPVNANKWARLWKGVGIMMLVLGITLLVGLASGAKSPLQPLAGLRAASEPHNTLPFQRIKDLAELEVRLNDAQGKIVMLDFYADWCVACKELEQFTFSDARVQQRLANVVLLQADVTKNSMADIALLKHFGLYGPPGILFFDSSGQITPVKVIGYQNADAFINTLDKLDL
jgi:thiol:disulfide interchange protein DsbD